MRAEPAASERGPRRALGSWGSQLPGRIKSSPGNVVQSDVKRYSDAIPCCVVNIVLSPAFTVSRSFLADRIQHRNELDKSTGHLTAALFHTSGTGIGVRSELDEG